MRLIFKSGTCEGNRLPSIIGGGGKRCSQPVKDINKKEKTCLPQGTGNSASRLA
jgi:hypothetical protein